MATKRAHRVSRLHYKYRIGEIYWLTVWNNIKLCRTSGGGVEAGWTNCGVSEELLAGRSMIKEAASTQ